MTASTPESSWRRAAVLAGAVFILNAAVTFENIWPTPAVTWTGGASVELAVCLVALAIAGRNRSRSSSTAYLGWLSALWIVMAIGRYAEVTAPALYGRDVNLYWDFRLLPDVAAMITRVAPWWLTTAVLLIVAFVVVLLFRLFRWCFRTVNGAMTSGSERRVLMLASAACVLVFGVQLITSRVAVVTTPVSATYLRQVRLVADGLGGSRTIPPSPSMDSSFAAIRGADVFLVFIESYGAVADRPDVASALEPARARFETDIHSTGRGAVSAYVESPTFGGSSWLAHISLLSGIEIRDPDSNARLMTQHRETLVSTFSHHGYRTIALMPGLRQKWPEGAFYRFDDIYGADRLAYRGPEFGWFALPDEFTLAQFDHLEAAAPRGPRFVVFPTISTHFPFSPTPPYQSDWSRMLDQKPYDGPAIVRAYARQPDWTNFTPGYIEAMSYDLAVLGGYLKQHADRDLVMILLGDHQPPAAVSGEGASWNVPVHIVASRRPLLDDFLRLGFQEGVHAHGPSVAKMHALVPLLLKAFDGHE
jgi:hypothetical protein